MKMDNMQIGYFIAECRKEKQITQQELADKLNITNKAVSKWETGKGLPDVMLLAALADILEVSVDEILKAKKNGNDSILSENRINNKTGEKRYVYQRKNMIAPDLLLDSAAGLKVQVG